MHKRIIIAITLIAMLTVGICSGLSAKEKRNAKTKPVEVKTSYNPAVTRVAVLPVVNIAPAKKYVEGEIDQSLVTARSLIEKEFRQRGFVVISDEKIASGTTRLDSTVNNNGMETAKKLNADFIVDCSIKELYTFTSGSFVERLAGVAVINIKIYDTKSGYLINDDFLDRRDSAPGIFGWTTRSAQMRERALGAVVNLSLSGLLKPYAISSKATSGEQVVKQDEHPAETTENGSDKQAAVDSGQTKKEPVAPAAANVEKTPPAQVPPQPQEPQITHGPKYLTAKGNSLVPLKAIGDWLGASVKFDKETKIIELKTTSDVVSLRHNSDVASVNGRLVQLQSPAIENAGTTYIPLRFVCDAFGVKVKFDTATGEIRIENSSANTVLILSKS
jgi:hypothetical protein